MLHRRRLMIKSSPIELPDIFGGGHINHSNCSWIYSTWEKGRLYINKSGGTNHGYYREWVVGLLRDAQATPDLTKKFNLKVKVKAKYGVYGNGVGTIQFALGEIGGSRDEVVKESEIRVVRDLTSGTEFNIFVDVGEDVAQLRIRYTHLTSDGSSVDSYQFKVWFEFYIEEITE